MRWLCFLALFLSFAANSTGLRIVSLAPHLTEWAFSLGAGESLVGVSAYSDYPKEATLLPVIADYQGADMAAILALQPDIVLAWDSGNRPQDIARLAAMGIKIFHSNPVAPQDIAEEIRRLGNMLGKDAAAKKLAEDYLSELKALKQRYSTEKPLSAFYYFNASPLVTVAENAWPARLLAQCNITTLFPTAPNDYPQVSVQEVLRRQPDVLIAAGKGEAADFAPLWKPHRAVLSAPLLIVNPDLFSRFTPRLLPALKTLCGQVDEFRQNQ